MKKLFPAALLAAVLPLSALAQPEGQAPSPTEGFMTQFDGNKDGKITLDEFKKPQMEAMERQMDQQFRYMDKDQNSAVDKPEVEAFAKEVQQRMQEMQQKHGAPAGKAQ